MCFRLNSEWSVICNENTEHPLQVDYLHTIRRNECFGGNTEGIYKQLAENVYLSAILTWGSPLTSKF